jgi:hypothetical protein
MGNKSGAYSHLGRSCGPTHGEPMAMPWVDLGRYCLSFLNVFAMVIWPLFFGFIGGDGRPCPYIPRVCFIAMADCLHFFYRRN